MAIKIGCTSKEYIALLLVTELHLISHTGHKEPTGVDTKFFSSPEERRLEIILCNNKEWGYILNDCFKEITSYKVVTSRRERLFPQIQKQYLNFLNHLAKSGYVVSGVSRNNYLTQDNNKLTKSGEEKLLHLSVETMKISEEYTGHPFPFVAKDFTWPRMIAKHTGWVPRGTSSNECWKVQIEGFKACEECKNKIAEQDVCTGKRIVQAGKNILGIEIPITIELPEEITKQKQVTVT
jgi:hypothetical protein